MGTQKRRKDQRILVRVEEGQDVVNGQCQEKRSGKKSLDALKKRRKKMKIGNMFRKWKGTMG